MTTLLLGCAICFGQSDPRMTLLLMGMLALPFTMVGGMMGFLYFKGVFSTPQVPTEPETNEPAST